MEMIVLMSCAAVAAAVIGAVLKIEADAPAPRMACLPAVCYQD